MNKIQRHMKQELKAELLDTLLSFVYSSLEDQGREDLSENLTAYAILNAITPSEVAKQVIKNNPDSLVASK